MFNSKKNRDSLLLIFMGLVTVIFLLYLFFPSGKGEKQNEKKASLLSLKSSGNKAVTENKTKDEGTVTAEKFLKSLKEELASIQELISSGESPFFPPPSDRLEELLRSDKAWDTNGSFRKILKFRFRDVGDIFKEDLPDQINDSAKFDIYIAVFLIRANNEMIISRSNQWTIRELNNNINLKPYGLINYEIQEDYQTIPFFFYTTLYIRKDNIFPPSSETTEFFKKAEKIMDLSPGQIVNEIKSLTCYTVEQKKFSITWREYDPLDPDDTGNHRGVSTFVQSWMKFKFIIYPGKSDQTWIRELIHSDRGPFELEDLEISEEIPGEKQIARSIFYSKNLSRFIVITDDPVSFSTNLQVERMLKNRVEEIKKNFIQIDMLDRYRDRKKFKDQLLKFGKYIYGIRPVFNGN